LYFNINGLSHKHVDELTIAIKKTKPLVVCLSETHITEAIFETELAIHGYVYYDVKSDNSRTGGCAMYIRNDVKVITVNRLVKIGSWYLTCKIKILNSELIISVLYRSPSSSEANFLSHFSEWLQPMVTKGGHLLITGDFNINVLKVNASSKSLKETISLSNLRIVNSEVSRYGKTSETLIDLMVSNITAITAKNADDMKIADHESIICEIGVREVKSARREKTNSNINSDKKVIKLYRKMDIEKLNSILRERNSNVISDDVDELADAFVNNLTFAIDESVPTKTIDCSKGMDKPWLRSRQVESDRKSASFKWKKCKLVRENKEGEEKEDEAWNDYKTARNKYTSTLRTEKKMYFEEKVDMCKGDSNVMWKTLKVLTDTDGKSSTKVLSDVEFENLPEELPLPDKFNDFFINSIKELQTSIEDRDGYDAFKPLRNRKCKTKFTTFKQMEYSDLKRIVNGLKTTSTCDGINVETLKSSLDSISDLLLKVINNSLAQGIVPSRWKKSTVIPIPKVPNPKKPQEVRPINMLPLYEKILEIFVHEQLVDYFEMNNLLYKLQFGFRKKRSTEAAIQMILTEWRKALNDNKFILTVLLDLKRAFETIDREKLIEKLRLYGISGMALKWIVSYMTDRSQVVNIDGVSSSEMPCDDGVPQGSVLGVLFFIIFINDINLFVKNVVIYLFADDILIFIIGDNLKQMCDGLNEDLVEIDSYYCANKVKSHPDKSQCMLITTSKQKRQTLLEENPDCKIMFAGKTLDYADLVKYLGVMVDYLLNFDENVKYVSKKIAKKTGYLCRIRKYLSPWCLTLIYNTIVAPHFNYCATILLGINKQDLNCLQLLQNRGMRTVLKCEFRTHRVDMLESLQWLSVEQNINFKVIMFIYDFTHDDKKMYFSHLYERNIDVHDHNTRTAHDFHMPIQNNNSGQKSLFVNGLKIYNELPDNVKLARSKNVFKQKAKDFVKFKYPLV